MGALESETLNAILTTAHAHDTELLKGLLRSLTLESRETLFRDFRTACRAIAELDYEDPQGRIRPPTSYAPEREEMVEVLKLLEGSDPNGARWLLKGLQAHQIERLLGISVWLDEAIRDEAHRRATTFMVMLPEG